MENPAATSIELDWMELEVFELIWFSSPNTFGLVCTVKLQRTMGVILRQIADSYFPITVRYEPPAGTVL